MIDSALTLPPPSQSNTPEAKQKIAQYVDGLVREHFARQAESGDLWGRSQINLDLYRYARRYDKGTGKIRVWKIQNAVESNVAIQTSKRPKFILRQRSTGQPPHWYYNAASAPQGFADAMNNLNPDVPLKDEEVKLLQQLIQQSQDEAAMTGATPRISPTILVRVDDAVIRRAANDVLDAKFDAADGVPYTRENVRYTNIFGYSFAKVTYNDNERRPVFRNIEPVCVAVDSTKTRVKEMAYVVEDQFLGLHEALQEYPSPEMQAAIKLNAQTGNPAMPGSPGYPVFWRKKYFQREVVIVRTAWIRHQPYPLTAEEAIHLGKVVSEEVDDTPTAPETPPTPLSSAQADIALPMETPDAPPPDQLTPVAPDMGDVGEQPPGNPVQPPAQVRLAYYAVGPDGQPDRTTEVTFPNEQMVRYSIREILIVAGKTYEDKECERVDIPIVQNVNIPIPFTPWGQGEPERLERIASAYNNVVTDIVVSGEYATSPAEITTNEVVKANPRLAGNAYTQPGNLYVVDSATWLMLGGDKGQPLIQTIMPPPTPPDQWKREQMLNGIINDSSDAAAVLRGDSPGADSSGRAIESLQSAGTSVIISKGAGTEDMLTDLGRIVMGDIVMRNTPEQLAEDFPKYSVWIWKEIHRRWMEHYLFCNLVVEIASGGAASRERRANTLIQARAMNVAVSQPEIMDAMDLDSDEQITRESEFVRAQSVNQQPIMDAQAQQAPQPGGNGRPTPRPSPPEARMSHTSVQQKPMQSQPEPVGAQ